MAMSSGVGGLLGSAAALLGSPVAGTSMRGPTNVAMWSCPLPSSRHCGLRKHSSSLSSSPPSPSFVTAVAAIDSSSQISPTQQYESNSNKYHFVANARFMLDEEEHFQELLFERLRNYGERNKERDF